MVRTDVLAIKAIANEFVSHKHHRIVGRICAECLLS